MGSFDNGTAQGGIFAQAKQFGAILRGNGPPVPAAGVVGDLYVDVQTWLLYEKREAQDTDPWGNYLFPVAALYQSGLKWFGSFLPTNDVGVNGDYYLLWGGYSNYGLQPSICGPKANGCWPESGNGPDLLLDPAYAGYTLPAGVSDEGGPIAFSASWQLVVAGVDVEYVMSIPVSQLANALVTDIGLAAPPAVVAVVLDPLYSMVDKHAV